MNRRSVVASLIILASSLGRATAADEREADRFLEEGFRGIYTVRRDGTNFKFLFAAPGMITTATPAWSHDGKMLACDGVPTIDAVTESKIFVHYFDGSNKGRTQDLSYGNTPSWSPDDRRIAYMINDANPGGAKGGVWTMNPDGKDRHWLARGWYPRWSPDGKLLCCHAWLGNSESWLFTIDAKGGDRRAVPKAKGWSLRSYGGSWSSDGKRIVFVGSFKGKHRLATVALSGEADSIRILYTNDDPQQQLLGPPAWSPDGRQIIFIIQPVQSGPRQWWDSMLYTIAADGRSAPTLLEGERIGNINRGANWSPNSASVVFSSER